MLWKSFALTALLALAALVPPSLAQAPKPGKEYVDAVDLGFKIKMPDGWDFIPPQPGATGEIGKYSNGVAGVLRDPKTGQPILDMDVMLLKFDRRPAPPKKLEVKGSDGETHEIELNKGGPQDFAAWLKALRGGWKQKEKKDVTLGKVAGARYVYTATIETIDCAFLAYEYKLKPDVDVVAVFFGPGDDKHWSKYEGPYDTMGRSFKAVDVANATAIVAKSAALRDQTRAKLEDEARKTPGWMLYETPNYFIISAKNDDKQFLEELKDRLEAIHEEYAKVYPPEMAEKMRNAAKAREAANPAPDKPKPEGEPDKPSIPGETRAGDAKVDPVEKSRCSVVRVCKDREQYMSYGAPGSSAGYWSPMQEELVIYDDQGNGGRRNTWGVLNHEAFHQYIFYFFGMLSPHSWYNEGTGDYFFGYQYEHKKFTVKANDWREREIQEALRMDKPNDRKFVPLKELVRYTQREYYGDNKYKLDGGANYAQGWSFIYFLRTGAKNTKGWNPLWSGILDTYLQTLVETDDLDKAVDKAFAGVDWDALEACWKEYILKG